MELGAYPNMSRTDITLFNKKAAKVSPETFIPRQLRVTEHPINLLGELEADLLCSYHSFFYFFSIPESTSVDFIQQ